MCSAPKESDSTIPDVMERVLASRGGSSPAIYAMVTRVLEDRHWGGGTLVDVGCGRGELASYVAGSVDCYIGADVVRYDTFPEDTQFSAIDIASGVVPLPDEIAEVVVAVETIEHVENPRAFFRELRRLSKPGGLIIVTTPNQQSLLSLITLLLKGEFNAFQEAPGLYPSHLTALLEVDLRRIARECDLQEIEINYSGNGRVPFTPWGWPAIFRGRRFSDNVLVSAKMSA